MEVLVVGGSENPDRYSNRAMRMLKKHGHTVSSVGLREGKVEDMVIKKDFPTETGRFHTVTLYVGPERQPTVMNQIIALHPQRVIFNPGTENPEFYKKLDAAGIAHEEACTLVMLGTGVF